MAAKKKTPSSASAPSTPAPQATSPAPAAAATTTSAGQAPAPQSTQAPNAATLATPVTGVANSGNHGTKIDLQTSYVALMAGLGAYYTPTAVLSLSTGDETCEALIADFQQFVSAAENTKAAYQAYRNAVQAERTILATVAPKRQGVRSIVEAKFGVSGTQLLTFGFMPRKPSTKTAASKAGAVVKGQATRTARGTTTRKQKQQVTGDVTGVTITPVTSGEPSSPNATPTPPAPAAASPQAAAKPPAGSSAS